MALVVEDGTGKSDADSYVSLAEANTYFAARNDPAAWDAATDPAKEAALRYAAVWMDGNWDWNGEILLGTQSRAFPRMMCEDHEGRLIDYDSVPQRVKDAQCELALVHIADALNTVSDTSGAEIQRIKVDVIELEYVERSTSYARRVPYVSKLLKGLFSGGTGLVPIYRS